MLGPRTPPPPPPPPGNGAKSYGYAYSIKAKDGDKTYSVTGVGRPGDSNGPTHDKVRIDSVRQEGAPGQEPAGPQHSKVMLDKAHIFVDGKEVGGIPGSRDPGRGLGTAQPDNIERVDVLKGDAARKFFVENHMTDDGRSVVLITTKNAVRR